ncbi:MAG: penicillin acylase family protein [Chloroflexi bacterium]|uniref:Penicillin acylase family protein n=1 Tax=Candidatus Chlorohelix allophototropha TaxID=3003348 RepID=A0A8T7LVF3_9CHLR|nr:penicillin acylase family protein [Chloroflexota bacterium]WJW66729.1 penicillin acylase family protein [Chloroflexota bacterium L227-S17]
MKGQKSSSRKDIQKVAEVISNNITDVIENSEGKPRKRGRKPRNLLLATSALGAVGYSAWQASKTRFSSKINGELKLSGLKSPVEVIRDKWGIPHLYAQSLSDLAFAQGFVQAQDRMWQMEFQRRVASGRLSEIFGDATLEADKMMRRLQLRRAAHNDYAHMDSDSEEKMVLERFVEGVNAYLNTKKLPLEFSLVRYKPEPWSPIDSLTWAKIIGVQQSTNLDSELVRAQMVQKLGAERAAKLEPTQMVTGAPLIIPPDADYSGLDFELILEEYRKMQSTIGAFAGGNSNNWAVSGSRTVTGKPMLCNDPHMAVTMPSTWYEMHLHSPEIDVTGASIPGIPLIGIGHNRHIAWGITNTMSDSQDAFIEKIDPTNPQRYEYKGEWREFEVVQEEIKIKGKASFFMDCARSVHGPLLSSLKLHGTPAADAGGKIEAPLAVSWNIYEPSKGIRTLLKLNQATNWQEFREALSTWDVGCFNFAYADVEGNIGYQFTGLIPIRGKGLGLAPSPGNTGEYDWQGYIPFEELPHIYNPEQGYIITTNQKVVGNEYPYWLGSDYLGENRAIRLRQLINSREKLSLDDVARFQKDQLCLPGLRLTRRLLQADATKGNDWQRRALGYLATWDGVLTAHSVAGSIYHATLQKLGRLVFEPIMGSSLTESYLGNSKDALGAHPNSLQSITTTFLIGRIEANDHDLLPMGKSWDDLLLEALSRAIELLRKKLGDDMNDWEWGKLHALNYVHPLGMVKPLNRIFNRGPYPLGGDWDTVWQAGYNGSDDNFSFNGATSSIRLVTDLNDWENTRFGCTSGQSGAPMSPHYSDLIEEWLAGAYHPHLFNRAAILDNAEGKLTLNPA